MATTAEMMIAPEEGGHGEGLLGGPSSMDHIAIQSSIDEGNSYAQQ